LGGCPVLHFLFVTQVQAAAQACHTAHGFFGAKIKKGANSMAKFMYLFRSNPETYRSTSPEQMQQIVKKWMEWKAGLEKNGHVNQLGERLDVTGKVVRGKTKTVTDGPYVEVKDSVQGYMLLEAKDLDLALELAKGCPVLERDGTVEVRPFISM
jgi:hypothetical protein